MSKKILLIEDDLDIQRVYSEKLKHQGYDVILAPDAGTGHHYTLSENPSLILLDIMLPGKMNGFELLEILKKDYVLGKIPVIVMTNLDTEKEQALKIGANDYMVKVNTSLEDLVAKVKKFI